MACRRPEARGNPAKEKAVARGILSILDATGDPGALGIAALLVVGAVCCFLGCRYFRFSAGAIGFVVGMELAARLALWQGVGRVLRVLLGFAGGAALAAVFVRFVPVAVFGMGALLATLAVRAATGAAGRSLGSLEHLLAALVGGFVALLLKRHAAVGATALCGGVAAMAAVIALVKRGSFGGALSIMCLQSHGEELVIFLLCAALVVVGGVVAQQRSKKGTRLDGKR
jgi:hypothetical protein